MRERLVPDALGQIVDRIHSLALKATHVTGDSAADSLPGLQAILKITEDLQGLINAPGMGNPTERRKDVRERHWAARDALWGASATPDLAARLDFVLTDAAEVWPMPQEAADQEAISMVRAWATRNAHRNAQGLALLDCNILAALKVYRQPRNGRGRRSKGESSEESRLEAVRALLKWDQGAPSLARQVREAKVKREKRLTRLLTKQHKPR